VWFQSRARRQRQDFAIFVNGEHYHVNSSPRSRAFPGPAFRKRRVRDYVSADQGGEVGGVLPSAPSGSLADGVPFAGPKPYCDSVRGGFPYDR
jgi:hypothetical protein